MRPEIEMLRNFANMILDSGRESGLDGFDIQDIGELSGVLVPMSVSKPCGESCPCAEVWSEDEFLHGITCHQKHDVLTASLGPQS